MRAQPDPHGQREREVREEYDRDRVPDHAEHALRPDHRAAVAATAAGGRRGLRLCRCVLGGATAIGTTGVGIGGLTILGVRQRDVLPRRALALLLLDHRLLGDHHVAPVLDFALLLLLRASFLGLVRILIVVVVGFGHAGAGDRDDSAFDHTARNTGVEQSRLRSAKSFGGRCVNVDIFIECLCKYCTFV